MICFIHSELKSHPMEGSTPAPGPSYQLLPEGAASPASWKWRAGLEQSEQTLPGRDALTSPLCSSHS